MVVVFLVEKSRIVSFADGGVDFEVVGLQLVAFYSPKEEHHTTSKRNTASDCLHP